MKKHIEEVEQEPRIGLGGTALVLEFNGISAEEVPTARIHWVDDELQLQTLLIKIANDHSVDLEHLTDFVEVYEVYQEYYRPLSDFISDADIKRGRV